MEHFKCGCSPIPGKQKAIRIESDPVIEARYSTKNNPIIEAPKLSESALGDLIQACGDMLTPIRRWTTIAMEIDAPVKNVFTHSILQIRPVQDLDRWMTSIASFPEISIFPQLSPNSHPNPILIDVAYDGVKSNIVEVNRRNRAADQAETLVAIGLWPMPRSIRRLHHPSLTLIWDSVMQETYTARLARGFSHPDLAGSGRETDIPVPKGQAFPSIDHEIFVRGPVERSSNDAPFLHPEFARILDAVTMLPALSRQALGRALHWLSFAVMSRSTTLQVIACASAIEALLPKTEVMKCETCKQDIYKISARFRDFVKTYATTPHSTEFLDIIYSARSKLLHGDLLYEADEPLFSFASRSFVQSHAAHQVARMAILNWLWEWVPK